MSRIPRKRKIDRIQLYISILGLHIHSAREFKSESNPNGLYISSAVNRNEILSVSKYRKMSLSDALVVLYDIEPNYITSVRSGVKLPRYSHS